MSYREHFHSALVSYKELVLCQSSLHMFPRPYKRHTLNPASVSQEIKHSRSASRDYQCSLTEVLKINVFKSTANTSEDFTWSSTDPELRQLASKLAQFH